MDTLYYIRKNKTRAKITKFTKNFTNNYDFMQIVNKITKMTEISLPSSSIPWYIWDESLI